MRAPVALACAMVFAPCLLQAAIRPLADDFVTLAESPDPKAIPLCSPSILKVDSGRLVASYERGKDGRKNGQAYTFVLLPFELSICYNNTW